MHKGYKPFSFGGGQDLFRALFLRTCTIEKFISLKRVLNTELEIFFLFSFFTALQVMDKELALGSYREMPAPRYKYLFRSIVRRFGK